MLFRSRPSNVEIKFPIFRQICEEGEEGAQDYRTFIKVAFAISSQTMRMFPNYTKPKQVH